MIHVIVLFSKASDAKQIRNALVRNGIDVTAVCTAGSQIVSHFGDLEDCLIVCGYKYSDRMMYDELHEYLPKEYEMLILASRVHMNDIYEEDNIHCIAMPIKIFELVESVQDILDKIERRKKKRIRIQRQRSPEERNLIDSAKSLLMNNNRWTENEAHRYLQKRSMDSGMALTETARMIIESYNL